MVVVILVAVIIAIIVGMNASSKAQTQVSENRVQEVMQKEINGAQDLRGYLNALEILNKVLQEHNIGEVTFSLIYPSAQSSTLVNFYIESYVKDHEWLQRYFFTIDVEGDIRNRKRLEKEGKTLLPPLPKYENFYQTGTIWENLTDDELDSLLMRIDEKTVKPDEPKFTKLVKQLSLYHCQENEVGVYLDAIAQTIREKFPHYDVQRDSTQIMVKPRK